MTHHDHHDHHHHHDVKSDLSFQEKLIKLLDHWIKHNHDHADTYQSWAQQAKENGMTDVAALIEEVHALTLQIDDKFKQAAAKVR
jgi:rubrerythrin